MSSVASNTERCRVCWVSGSECNSREASASCVCKSAGRFTYPTLDPGGRAWYLRTGGQGGCLLNRPGLSVGSPRCRQHLSGTYPPAASPKDLVLLVWHDPTGVYKCSD